MCCHRHHELSAAQNFVCCPVIAKLKQNILQIRILETLSDTLLTKLMSGALHV